MVAVSIAAALTRAETLSDSTRAAFRIPFTDTVAFAGAVAFACAVSFTVSLGGPPFA
jgi:hypothetical protein